MQPENRICYRLNILKHTTERGSYHCSCVIDIDALAYTIRASSPAGIDEIATDMMLLDALTQQVCVLNGRQRQEFRAEARTEGGLRRRNAPLRSGQFAGIAGEEIIHVLLRCQLRDRGQDTKGVRR